MITNQFNKKIRPNISISQKRHHSINYKIIVICLCAFVFSPLLSQTTKSWQWVQQLGSPSWDRPAGMVINNKDKLYVTGTFSSKLTVGNKMLDTHGNDDIFLARYDTKGNIESLHGIGGKGQDQAACISVARNGAVILSGIMTDSCYWNNKPVEGTGNRLFVSSVNVKGNLNWLTNIKIDGNTSVSQMVTDSVGNIYATGNFSGTIESGDKRVSSTGRTDVFLIKILSNGQIDKLISFGSTKEECVNVITGNSRGDVLIAGNFTRGFNIGSIPINAGGGKSNIFMVKFNSSLEPVWNEVLSGNDLAQVSSVIMDASDNFYVGGSFTLDLTLKDTILQSQGQADAYLLKYKTDGEPVWTKRIGSDQYDYITGLNNDNIGGIIATGSIGDTTLIDSLNISPKWQGDAAFIAQFTENGKVIWGDYISGVGRNFSKASVLDKNGNLYYYGSFSHTFRKDVGELVSLGDQDLFLACYFNCPEEEIEFSGNRAICPNGEAEIQVENRYKYITWNDTLFQSPFYIADKPGYIKVSIVNRKGCRYTDSIELKIAERPLFSLGNDTLLYIGDSLLLLAPVQISQFQWMDGSTQTHFYAYNPDEKKLFCEYWISYSDSLGCAWNDTIGVNYSEIPDIGDDLNPRLIIYPNPVTDILKWKLDIMRVCRLSFEITSNSGQVLYYEKIERYDPLVEKQVDVSQYPLGTYIVRIRSTSTGKVFASAPVVKR